MVVRSGTELIFGTLEEQLQAERVQQIPIEQRPETLRTNVFDTMINTYKQAQRYTLGSSIYQGVAKYSTDGRFDPPGLSGTMTAAEAQEEYGLQLPDAPDTQVSRAWAYSESIRKQRLANIKALNTDNPNSNIAVGFGAGALAVLTDPFEVGLNMIPLGRVAGLAGKAVTRTGFGARAAAALKAGLEPALEMPLVGAVGKAVTSKSGQLALENLTYGAISTAATVGQAAATDAEIFDGGYGWHDAAFDTATSVAAGGLIDFGARAVGRAITSSTAKKIIDPLLQKTETITAKQAGETPRVENMVDVSKTQQALEQTRQFLDEQIKQAAEAEFTAPTPEGQRRFNYSTEPIIQPRGLKSKTVVGGKSLVLPLAEGTKISSQFGMRHAPKAGASTMHKGIDFAVGAGTPIRSSGAGRVTFSGKQKGYGNIIIIDHGNGISTAYAHAEKLNFKKGDTVKRGQVIGTVGSTGNSTGPHLHFEVRKNGKQVDPNQWLRKGAELQEPPAAKPLERMEMPEEIITRGTEMDEAVGQARTLGEIQTSTARLTDDLMDDMLETVLDAPRLPDDILRDSARSFQERLFSIAEYIGVEIDPPRILQGFERGASSVNKFLSAIEKLPPEKAAELTQNLWRNLVDENGRLKRSIIAKGKETVTKMQTGAIAQTPANLAKLSERQEALAELLPQLYAYHKVLQQADPSFVTEELPAKLFLEMLGADLSDTGKALLGTVPNVGNMPLYRMRKTLLDRLGKEANEVNELLKEVSKKQGRQSSIGEAANPDFEAIVRSVDDEIASLGGAEPDKIMEVAKEKISQRFDDYFKTGLFAEKNIASKQKLLDEYIDGIDTRTFRENMRGGDVEQAKITKIENHRNYSKGIEAARPVVEVCLNRGFGSG